MTRNTGVSLVEVLVAGTLLALLFSLTWSAVAAGLAYFHRSEAVTRLDQQAITTLGHLSRELSETSMGAVDLSTPQAAVFPLARDLDGKTTRTASGTLEWSSLVSVSTVAKGDSSQLVRYQRAITPHSRPPHPSTLPDPNEPHEFHSSHGSVKLLQNHIESIEFSAAGETIHFVLSLKMDVGEGSLGLVAETKIHPRN